MAAFANITLYDAVTPTAVAHVFKATRKYVDPRGRLGYRWQDFSVNNGVPLLTNTIDLWVSYPTASNVDGAAVTVEGMLRLPTPEQAAGGTSMGYLAQPKLAGIDTFWFKQVRSSRSGSQQALDVNSFARGFCGSATVADIVGSLTAPI